jgi:hypothetical protein
LRFPEVAGWVFAPVSDSGLTMGCDGGTIPKRHELVKGPKKVEKVSSVGPGGGKTDVLREQREVESGSR